MRTIDNLAVAALLSTAFLCTALPASGQQANDARGMAAFKQRKCTLCHSVGETGNRKGALDAVGSKLTPAEIRAWIVDPEGMAAKTNPPPTRKPPMKKMSIPDEDVEALVAMLAQRKKS